MNKFEELKEVVNTIEYDAYKCFFRLNVAAGRRVRKQMQIVKALAAEIREEVLDLNKKKLHKETLRRKE